MLDLIVPILMMLSQILSLRLCYGAVLSLSYIFLVIFFFLNVLWLCLTFVNIWLILSQSGYLGKTPKLWVHFFFPFSSFFTSAVLKQYITSVQNSSGSVTSNAILMVGFFPLEKKIIWNWKCVSVCVWAWVPIWQVGCSGLWRREN